MPTFGSLFSGIGGMDLGLERAGWECRFQVEIDDWRRQVLTRHWPEVPKWKDVRGFGESAVGDSADGHQPSTDIGRREAGAGISLRVDLICGGFPCQDLSVAGKRAGLGGERSGLFFEFARIAGELRPQWLLIENVPGLLSSNQGLDFAIVLDTLDELGYGVAWHILNSQYFGVPQRRRRVFIVGYLGGPCPPEILFESEGGGGNPQTGGKAGEGVAHALRSSPRGVDEHTGTTYVAQPLTKNNSYDSAGKHGTGPINLIAQPLRSNRWGGSDSHGDEGNVVIHGRSNKPREFSGDPHGGGSLGVKVDTASYALDQGSQYVGAPADADGVREATGLSGRLDACTRCPDGRRYAALGDAVTVPVAEWIGRRIMRLAL